MYQLRYFSFKLTQPHLFKERINTPKISGMQNLFYDGKKIAGRPHRDRLAFVKLFVKSGMCLPSHVIERKSTLFSVDHESVKKDGGSGKIMATQIMNMLRTLRHFLSAFMKMFTIPNINIPTRDCWRAEN